VSVASSLHARFQELDLSTQCLMGQDSSREEPWTETVELTLRKLGNYQKVYEWVGVCVCVCVWVCVGVGVGVWVCGCVGVGVHASMYVRHCTGISSLSSLILRVVVTASGSCQVLASLH